MQALSIIFLAILAFVAFSDEKKGFYIVILVGLSQDLLRKLMPGEPVYMTVLVAGYVGVIMIGMLMRGQIRVGAVMRMLPELRAPIMTLVVYIAFQCLNAYVNSGNPFIVAIGILAYFGPFASLYLGFYLTATQPDRQIIRYMWFYLLVAVSMAWSVYFSYMGSSWTLLDSVGVGLHGYNPLGGTLTLHNGFWRGSELAGGYCATAAIFSILLFVCRRRMNAQMFIVIFFFMFLVGAVFVTGRRKFLVEIAIFVITYGCVSIYLRHSVNRIVQFVLLCVLLGSIAFMWLIPSKYKEGLEGYYARGLQLEDQTAERFEGNAIHNLKYVYYRNGFLGKGAGIGSQGAQHFGGGSSVVGAAAEGGLAKVLAELGVPGLVLLAWFALAIIQMLVKRMRALHRVEFSRVLLISGVAAALVANAAVFTIAHQIFGDVFYMLTIGWLVGALMALVSVSSKQADARY